MSIATDEAEQWAQSRYFGSVHTERHDGRAVSVPDYPQKTNLRREGYIAGRTAEPTEAEIEASAFAQFKAINNSSWKPTEEQYREAWDALPNMVSDDFRRKARIGLEAARKAVTE